MIRFVKLLSVAILLPVFSYAQSNFKPGYVITLTGDTIHGLINLKDALYPREITFKKESTGSSQLFTANDIKYFQVDNIVAFRKYAGAISADNTDISKIGIGSNAKSERVVVFLRLEEGGPNVNLYSYADNTKTRYFIAKQDQQPDELVYRVYYTSGQNSYTKTEAGYKAQLLELANIYATDSKGLLDEIEEAKYNVADFRSVTRRINNTKVSQNVSKLPTAVFFAGVGINSTKFEPSGSFPFFNPQSHTSLFPKITLGVNLYPNPAVGKLIFRGEVSFTKNSYKTDVDSYTDNRPLSKSTYAFDQYVFAVSPQIQYHLYNADDFKFYINAGVSLNASKYTGNSYHNNYTDQTNDHVLDMDALWVSFPVKTGIVLNKKIEIFATYILPASFSPSMELRSIQAGINYIFN